MFRKDSRYFRLGLTLLAVIVLSTLFAVTLINIGTIFSVLKSIISIFSFAIYGVIFAYLMNPLMKLVEKLVRRLLCRSNVTERGLTKLSRIVGVIVSLLAFLAIVYGLLAMVVPPLVDSIIETFSPENLQSYYVKITDWLTNVVRGTPLEDWLRENDPIKAVQDWLTEEINIFSTLGSAVTEVYGVAKVLFNMVIGLVAAVYLLISKDRFISQIKKIIVAVISYVGMVLLKLPYPLLSSAFIGITNIIPFFGPLIGIVIGGVLIVLQSPIQALTFLIFELILQQVDGNIIGPRILGGRLGISDFWILVSITVFGSLFGFGGMLLGVPVFTVLYTLLSQAVSNALRKKHLPEKTTDYYSILCVEDLEKHEKDFGESTVFYSGDTYETAYDPDDDFEYGEFDDEADA